MRTEWSRPNAVCDFGPQRADLAHTTARVVGNERFWPSRLEAGVILALGLVMLGIAIWEFSATE